MKFYEIKEEYKSFLKNRNNFLRDVSILYYFLAIVKIYQTYSHNGNVEQAIIKWGIIYYIIFIFIFMPLTLLLQWMLHELTNKKNK